MSGSGHPSRRHVLLGSASAAMTAVFARRASAQAETIRIGVLCDLNGPYSTMSGLGSIQAAKFAAEDFTRLNPDVSVEVVAADFQLKPDVGLGILRDWFDTGGVDCVIDFPMSALALGATHLVKDRNRVALFTATATDELTGAACGPNHIHWTYDTYALATLVGRAVIEEDGDTWFVIAADYAMGHAMQRRITAVVMANGGKVVGSVAHPFPSTGDFASYLLQAQASGAKVICFANAGDDLVNCLKQALEFGIRGRIMAAPLAATPQVHAAGLPAAQGLRFATAFYWDRNDASRAFARRMNPFLKGFKPAQAHAGAYAATLHYLKAVADLGVARAKSDGRATVARMKAIPTEDPYFGKGYVRQDGRTIHDMLLLHVKSPAASLYPWDYADVARVVPGELVFRPLDAGGCRMAT